MSQIDFFGPLLSGALLGAVLTYAVINMMNERQTNIEFVISKDEMGENVKVVTDKRFIGLEQLKTVLEYINKSEIHEWNKERIVKVVDSEIYMLQNEIYKDLGKKTYESIKKEL